MLFKELVVEYFKDNKIKLVSYITICSTYYILKNIAGPIVYSKFIGEGADFISSLRSLFIIWILIIVSYIIKNNFEKTMVLDFLAFIRKTLMKNVFDKNNDFFNGSSVGKDISNITEVTRHMRDLFIWLFQMILPVIIVSMSIVFYIFTLNKTLGVLMICYTMVIISIMYVKVPVVLDGAISREKKHIEIVSKFDETFSNLFNIYINNQINDVLKENEDAENDYADFSKKNLYDRIETMALMIKIVTYIFSFISLIVVDKQYTQNKISKEILIRILFIFTFYINMMDNISDDIPSFMISMGSIMNYEIYKKKSDGKNVSVKSIDDIKDKIVFNNISFDFKNTSIFKDFNLTIDAKKRTILMGESGRGKTTLIKLLLKFYTIKEGSITIDGVDIKEIKSDDIRKCITYVNQRTTLFNSSIMENMKYGNGATSEEVNDFVKKHDLLGIFGDLEKKIEQHGSNMSIGMQKIIFIIRGILKKTSVYVFDEPLSGIDPDSREKIINMIDGISRDKTVIIITHDNEIEKIADFNKKI